LGEANCGLSVKLYVLIKMPVLKLRRGCLLLREVELRRSTLDILRRIERSRFYVIFYTADYGCAECEILEELIKKEGLEDLIDLKIVITHDEESLDLATEELGISGIPLLVVKNDNGILRIDDFEPEEQLRKLKEAIKHRIELYNRLKKQYEEHARKISKLLGKDVVVNPKIIPLIIKRIEDFGKPYCPCRTERNEKTICPCFWHVDELKRYGRCKCGLFITKH